MRIVIYDRYLDHVHDWLMGLVGYLRSQDHQVIPASQHGPGKRGTEGFRRLLDGVDHVFCWNGNLDCYKPLLCLARERGILVTFVECGWFPQRDYYYFDSQGVNAKSSLMTDDLSWITPEHLVGLDKFAAEYLNGRAWNGAGDYILCPLQLEGDTNIREHSPWKTMQRFIDYVEQQLCPHETVLFKAHPLADHRRYRAKTSIVRTGDFLTWAQNATRVVGINSTALLEVAMMGVPVTALGEGLSKTHARREQKLLAALVDRQIPVESTDVGRWVEPFLRGNQHASP